MINGHSLKGHSSDSFERLLDHIEAQADLVDVAEAMRLIDCGDQHPRPKVAFTFDDAFIDWSTHIGPALRRRGVSAAFFLSPGLISLPFDEFNERLATTGASPITEDGVCSLVADGHHVGAHTINHVSLADPLTPIEALRTEIVECRTQIERITGVDCPWFAWTYGGYRDISSTALEIALGAYERVFSSDGYPSYTASDTRVINRRHIEPFWGPSDVNFFLRKDRLAYKPH